MILIRFPNHEAKQAALGGLAERFDFKSWATGEMLVPAEALPFLTLRGIEFSIEEPSRLPQKS